MVKKKNSQDKMSFEDAINRLEVIIADMENSELSLDELLGSFSEGVHLLNNCRGELNNAQKQIEELAQKLDK